MFGSTKYFPSWYTNCKLLKLTLLSSRIVLALVWRVSSIKANAFKSQCFDFILVEWWHDIRSTTSTPLLVWLYITRTCAFDLWPLVTFTLSCMVVKTAIFFFPDFFFLIYESFIMSFLSWYACRMDFSSLPCSNFITFGMPLRSWHMVPTMVKWWSIAHSPKFTDVKYHSNIAALDGIELWKFGCQVLGVPVRTRYVILRGITSVHLELFGIRQREISVGYGRITNAAIQQTLFRWFLRIVLFESCSSMVWVDSLHSSE